MKKLKKLVSRKTGIRYTLVRRLGKGGFGEAWEAIPHKGRRQCRRVCVKLNRESGPWHRECYFGEIFRGYPGAIQMSDDFVYTLGNSLSFCSVFELATGSVFDFRPEWTVQYTIRQLKRVIEATAKLHRMGAVHRDITPMNVLLTLDKKQLVLTDFGIALHGVDRPVKADCFNAWYAPDSVFRASANWEPRDDVWQLGQLMAFLMDRNVDSPIRPEDVGTLDCPDKAKAIIYRSIAPRQHRLAHAGRVLDIWESPSLPFSRANRIDGLGVVFTGPGSLPRSELERITRRAGGIPQRKVSKKTGIVVVGGNSPLWAAGSEGGKKILAALEQRDRGTGIRFIREDTLLAAASHPRNA